MTLEGFSLLLLFLRTNFKMHIKISPRVGNYLLEEARQGVLGEATLVGGVDRSPGWVQLLQRAAAGEV